MNPNTFTVGTDIVRGERHVVVSISDRWGQLYWVTLDLDAAYSAAHFLGELAREIDDERNGRSAPNGAQGDPETGAAPHETQGQDQDQGGAAPVADLSGSPPPETVGENRTQAEPHASLDVAGAAAPEGVKSALEHESPLPQSGSDMALHTTHEVPIYGVGDTITWVPFTPPEGATWLPVGSRTLLRADDEPCVRARCGLPRKHNSSWCEAHTADAIASEERSYWATGGSTVDGEPFDFGDLP